MKNIKLRYIWISIGISFLLAVGLILGVTQTSGVWTNVFIVLIAIVFIYMTIAIQYATTKTFRYKAKPINYPTIEYEFSCDGIDELIKKNGYKPRVTSYGISYLKVDGTDAYKIVLVRNCEKYFNQEENNINNQSSEKSLEKCKRFIGAEIFLDYDSETLKKLPDFNFQGNNVYYTAFYLEESKLVCLNFIEPNDNFKELYSTLKIHLNAKDVVYEGGEKIV